MGAFLRLLMGLSSGRLRHDEDARHLQQCCTLRRHIALRVHVQRDPAVRVPQNLLDRLHVFLVSLHDGTERVAEDVPGDVLVDACLGCRRSHVIDHGRLGPVGRSPLVYGDAKTQSSSIG